MIHGVVREKILSVIMWQVYLFQISRYFLARKVQRVRTTAIVNLLRLEPLLYG
jgi:hypothetical protein